MISPPLDSVYLDCIVVKIAKTNRYQQILYSRRALPWKGRTKYRHVAVGERKCGIRIIRADSNYKIAVFEIFLWHA